MHVLFALGPAHFELDAALRGPQYLRLGRWELGASHWASAPATPTPAWFRVTPRDSLTPGVLFEFWVFREWAVYLNRMPRRAPWGAA